MPRDVYILGAGASRADTEAATLPLPLAKDFFTAPYLKEYWTSTSGFQEFWSSALGTLLQQYFGLHQNDSTNSRPNVEEVYSFVNRVLTTYSSSRPLGSNSNVRLARDELLRFIRYAVYYPVYRREPSSLHRTIASAIDPTDSIISFNWDLLADQALTTTDVGRTLLETHKSLLRSPSHFGESGSLFDLESQRLHRGWLLKMHGAVNLAVCTSSDCPRFQMPLRFEEFDAEGMQDFPCLFCGSEMEPFIVPPDVNKTYREKIFSRLQASLAAGTLRTASRLIIVGYSFPIFDFEAAVMLRLARLDWAARGNSQDHLREVILVNPQVEDPAYVGRARDLLGLTDSVNAHGHNVALSLYSTVNEFLQSLRANRPLQTKKARRRATAKRATPKSLRG